METVKYVLLEILTQPLRLVLNHVEQIKFYREVLVDAKMVMVTTQKELALIVVQFQAVSLLMDFVLPAHSDKLHSTENAHVQVDKNLWIIDAKIVVEPDRLKITKETAFPVP